MLPLVWTNDATTDLLAILDFIGARDVGAADRLNDLIQRAVGRLPRHPHMHRPGRLPGTREAVVHPNYLIVYRVGHDAIEILAIVHARRRYP